MALTVQPSVASLVKKSLDRQSAIAASKFKLNPNQVKHILLARISDKNLGPYNELVKVLNNVTLNDENFQILLEDCQTCVVWMGRDLASLVNVLLNLNWSQRSHNLIDLFTQFILNLVTAHSYHVPLVMASLIKQFKEEGEIWKKVPSDEDAEKWSNTHSLIAQIVAVMPMTSEVLLQTLFEQYPYFKASCYVNRAFVHNLIWITKYIPSLRDQIISGIISRMIMMDVNMSVETSKNKQQPDTIFNMEIDENDTVSESLDYCMLEMLDWLQEERDLAFNTLCSVFEKIILPTHGIRHVQFLLLYTISINQQCADRTLNNLWILAAGLNHLGPGALYTRRTAASHLSGLLARCARVPNSRLIHYIQTMCQWCHSYITATQESTAIDNVKVHGTFHAICHAIFYLIAFKHQYFFSNKECINFVESLNLPRLVTCALNPLRTCPTQVTRAFASVTRAHQVVYCQAIIEKNARQSLTSIPVEYDDWFPYDPYNLPRSGKIIWPLCVKYTDWPNEIDDKSHQKKLEGDDDDYLTISPSQSKLASSLSNCISPGFKSTYVID